VSISNDGNVIAIGIDDADLADGALADNGGIVRMYHYVGSSWVLNSTLVNEDTGTDEHFGMMVQLSGDGKRMIVSAGRDNDDLGKLYTFEYIGTSWIKKQPSASFGATGVNSDDHLGYGATSFDQGVTLSRDGSVIVGGELGHDTATLSNAGRTRVWNMPSNIKSIWGSNDDVNWTKIVSGPTREEATSNVAGLAFGYDDHLEFKNLDNPNYYKYHAIVADAFTRLKDVKLFGIRNQGSSTLHDGTLTLTKKVTAPQLESTGILNMKGDYTEIRANSNVVTEFNRSKKFMKFPRVLLTSENDGGYIVTSSEEISGGGTASWQNWKPFGGFFSAQHAWLTGSDSYPSVAGAASTSGTTEGFTLPQNLGTGSGGSATANGSWLKLQLPHKITLQYIIMNGNNVVAPDDFDVLGSNDDTNWNILGSFTTPNPSLVTRMDQFGINATTSYLYYAVIIKSHRGTNHPYSGIYNLEYYGTPEYDPEANGVDVVVKSVPNVPNTDWLEVYYDAKDLADGSTTVNDLKPVGTANNGVANGNLSVSDGAFTFDGSGDYISSTVTTTTGAFIHTFAFWMNIPSSAATNSTLIGFGSQASDEASVIRFDGVEKFRWYFWGNDIKFTTPNVRDKWVHVVATYDGGNESGITVGNVGVSRKIFINTKETTVNENVGSSAGSDALNLLSTSHTFRVGSSLANSEVMTGKIANARLFNRVLTSDEIYQLYAYQKEYFGHGALGMTLKAGRLGIGTSEPQVALDVKGLARFNNVFFYARARTTGTNYATTSFQYTGGRTSINDVQRSGGGLTLASDGCGVRVTSSDAAGVYMVYCQVCLRTTGTTSRSHFATLRKNTVQFATANQVIQHLDNSTYNQHILSGLIDLDVGDEVTHETSASSSFNIYSNATQFYMYRISS
jgi:hypothetical protein